MPALPLGAQFPPDVERVFDHVHQPEDGHFHQEGGNDVPRQVRYVDGEGPVEGEPESVQQGAQDGDQADEKRRADGGDIQAVVLVVAAPHEEKRADEHAQQDQGIAQVRPERTDDVHALEGPLPEDEQLDEQAQGEHRDDGEHQPAHVLPPGTPVAGRDMPGAGVQVQRPADDFRRHEGGEGAVEDFILEIEQVRPQVSQDVAQDVHEQDADGGELHREVPPVADRDREGHRQGRQQEGIRPSEPGAHNHRHDVQRRESVDDPTCPHPSHTSAKLANFRVLRKRAFPFVPKNGPPVRQNTDLRVFP